MNNISDSTKFGDKLAEQCADEYAQHIAESDKASTLEENFIAGFNKGYIEAKENARVFINNFLEEVIVLWLPDLKIEPFHTQALELMNTKFDRALVASLEWD